jgi:hypothetical protein
MTKKALKIPDNNNGVRRSTQVKYHVQIFTYDGFVAHHYAYMVRVIQEVEPTCFEQTVGNPKWDNAMDEENNWVQMGVQSQAQCKWICE